MDRVPDNLLDDGVVLVRLIYVGDVTRLGVLRAWESVEVPSTPFPHHILADTGFVKSPQGEEPAPRDALCGRLKCRGVEIFFPVTFAQLLLCDTDHATANGQKEVSHGREHTRAHEASDEDSSLHDFFGFMVTVATKIPIVTRRTRLGPMRRCGV